MPVTDSGLQRRAIRLNGPLPGPDAADTWAADTWRDSPDEHELSGNPIALIISPGFDALAEARSPRPGGAGVLAKLAEVLFIEVLRLYMNEQREGRTGWLAGVSDRIVGAALNTMHKSPAHAWTLEELARAAGTSRSVLAERFQHLVGSSPMQYLTQWRMLLATNLLCRSNAPLARIAEEVGYQTDTAFIRAFRREFGSPPATWRRSQSARHQVL